MDFYRKIYDPTGRVFEISPERADDLVLNKGWSNTPPKKKNVESKREEVVKDEVEEDDTEETLDSPDPKPYSRRKKS